MFAECYLKRKNKEANFKRIITEENMSKLKSDLTDHNWDNVRQCESANDAYDSFINTVQECFDINCPLRKTKAKHTFINKPWLTKGLVNACKKQKTLYKRFLKNKTIENESKYKVYKNKLTSVKRFCEKVYYSSLIENNKNDIKATWKTLNKIISKAKSTSNYPDEFKDENGSIFTNSNEIVNNFNIFFINVGPNLAKNIDTDKKSSIFDYMDPPNGASMYLIPVSNEEIVTTAGLFKNKTSEDSNTLSMNVVKNIINSVVTPFQHICNLSFKTGSVPDAMKIAKVIPLFKSGDKHFFTNYRPVALLPQFSKILEKLFCKRLNAFIDRHNLISDNQYGFRPNRSTSTALLELVEEIVTANDRKKYTVGVFIDLRKAFDTIDHDLLLRKLENMGIRGTVNNWLQSYLNNRKQYVALGNVSSSLSTVLCGVPQGSVLGPLLFILYINDICNVSKLLQLILFADDTNLFRSSDNLQNLCNEISTELCKLNIWYKRIRGTVNNWLQSYLNNRKQYVALGNVSSSLSTVLCGVPQGSVLGPLLFIFYINDICNVSKLLQLILFADDTNLFRSSDNLQNLCNEISTELCKLNIWFKVNKLSLNVAKTNFIVFSGRKKAENARITIENNDIERVSNTKFLGVMIDEKLTWKQHISNLKVKLSK